MNSALGVERGKGPRAAGRRFRDAACPGGQATIFSKTDTGMFQRACFSVFHAAWSLLSCQLQRANALLPLDSARPPTVIDRNNTEFTRRPNRAGVFTQSWNWGPLTEVDRACLHKQPHWQAHPDWPNSETILCCPIHSGLMTDDGHGVTKEYPNSNSHSLD